MGRTSRQEDGDRGRSRRCGRCRHSPCAPAPCVSARTTRQKRVQSMTAMAMITECRPVPSTATSRMREQHRRKRHPDVDDARDDPVGPAAEIAGDKAEHRADEAGAAAPRRRRRSRRCGRRRSGARARRGRDCRCRANSQARRPAIQNGGSCAEHQVLRQRIVRRDQRREERRQRDDAASRRPGTSRERDRAAVGDSSGLSHGAAAG